MNQDPGLSEGTEPSLVFPDLSQAELDAPTLRQLFADIEGHTEFLDLVVKGAPQTRASSAAVGLQEAHKLLMTKQVRGVQIRYRYDGDEWSDTLIQHEAGVRLVRTRHLRGE